ncbi:Blue-light-activated protein [compost metagenome]
MAAKGISRESATLGILLAPACLADNVMGERVAHFDWARTACGPLARWQAAQRIAVDMMMPSPFPCAVVWGADLTVIHNDAYLGLFPEGHETLGERFDVLWGEVWGHVGPRVFNVLEGRSSLVESEPVRIARGNDAEPAWFVFSYSPLRDEQGEVAGFLHTVIDTTASVEAQGNWRQQAQMFEGQIARYMADRERIWQLSRDAMIIVTPDLKLHAANPAWYRMLGWDEAAVQDSPILELIHPADRAEVTLAVLDTEHCQQLDTRMRHQDGHYRWLRWNVSFDGATLTAVGRDITEARDEAIRQSEALLRDSQRLEAIGQLAGGMAHELNNLLSGIGGSLELLQRRLAQGRLERLDNYVDLARDSVQRAMNLTHRLLAFSRNQPLRPKALDLSQQLWAMEPLLSQALGPEMRLQWQLDVAPWTVCLDVTQFENALINLCANARDACLAQGSVTIRSVNQRLAKAFPDEHGLAPGDYVALQVEDNGQGMSAADLARAFEPFFTTKPLGRGSGMGLAMVYGFVGQSGGYVWIESTLEHGTKVCMLFPRSLEPLAQQPPALVLPARRAKGQRLLLIDDEHNLRLLMREFLCERGFEVCDVMDANSALERFRHEGPFDLVITDIGLPGGFSGRQVARAMRMINPQQKILFITGYTEQPVEQSLLDEPGTALMLKPFLLDSLAIQAQHMLAD